MSPENNQISPEQSTAGEWRKIIGVLSRASQDVLGDFGRKSANITIDRKMMFFDRSLEVRVESNNIYNFFTVIFRVPDQLFAEDRLAGQKYISLELFTGEDLPIVEAEFTVSKLGVSAYGLMLGIDEEIKLDLLKKGQPGINAALNFENIAKDVILHGKPNSLAS